MQLRKNRYAGYYDASMDDETLDNELASETSDGLMSKEDKIKLDKMIVSEDGSVNINVNASEIITDESHQFVTEEDKQKVDNLLMTEDGKVVLPASNVLTNVNKQFVNSKQISKIENSVSANYDESIEAIIFS